MSERKKTNRKVDLISSHSDNENEDGPLAAFTLEAASELYKNNIDRVPPELTCKPKAGEQLIYEDIFIPDIE